MSRARAEEIHELFLTLWDKAVATPGYHKPEWMRLQALLYAARPPRRLRETQHKDSSRASLEATGHKHDPRDASEEERKDGEQHQDG
jgi:hypothetical protein